MAIAQKTVPLFDCNLGIRDSSLKGSRVLLARPSQLKHGAASRNMSLVVEAVPLATVDQVIAVEKIPSIQAIQEIPRPFGTHSRTPSSTSIK